MIRNLIFILINSKLISCYPSLQIDPRFDKLCTLVFHVDHLMAAVPWYANSAKFPFTILAVKLDFFTLVKFAFQYLSF